MSADRHRRGLMPQATGNEQDAVGWRDRLPAARTARMARCRRALELACGVLLAVGVQGCRQASPPATQALPDTQPATMPETQPAESSATQPTEIPATEPATTQPVTTQPAATQPAIGPSTTRPATALATEPASQPSTQPSTQSAVAETQPATQSHVVEPDTRPATGPATLPATAPAATQASSSVAVPSFADQTAIEVSAPNVAVIDHPVLSAAQAAWPATLLAMIAGLFAAAIVVGPAIVSRAERDTPPEADRGH